MNGIRIFEIVFLLLSFYQSISAQSVSFTCTAIDASCKLTASNTNTSVVHIKLTLAVPTSNKWYAISFNNAKSMIGTSVIMIEYSNGAYNPYTGFINTYAAPSKDSTAYLKNFVANTVGSTVNLDFDAPSQLVHSINNALLDLNNCYSIAIGTGAIVSGFLSKHTSYPQFSSTCYKLVSPVTTTTTLAPTTTTTTMSTTTKPTTTTTTTAPTTTKPTTTVTPAGTTFTVTTTATTSTTRTSTAPTTTTSTATFPTMTTTTKTTTTTTSTRPVSTFTFPSFTDFISINKSQIISINNVVVLFTVSIGMLMKYIILSS